MFTNFEDFAQALLILLTSTTEASANFIMKLFFFPLSEEAPQV